MKTMTNGSQSFDVQFEKNIESRLAVVGDASVEVHHVPVEAASLFETMAEKLYNAINQLSFKELPFTQEEVTKTFDWLLYSRIWYVSGGRGEVHPRDVEYPALLGPILAAIGKYKDGVKNVEIVPVALKDRDGAEWVWKDGDGKTMVKSGDDAGEDQPVFLFPDMKTRLKRPDYVSKTIAALRVHGVPTVFGLPMDKEVDSDEIFRLDVADGVLKGNSSTAPSALVVFARSAIQMMYISGLYGNTRVSYVAVSHLEQSVEDLIIRNIQGSRASLR